MYLLALTLTMRFRSLGFKSFFLTSSAPCWFLMLLISYYGHAWIDPTPFSFGSMGMGGLILFYYRPIDTETYLRTYHSAFNQKLLHLIPELAIGAPIPHAVAMCFLTGKSLTDMHTLGSEGMMHPGTKWPKLSAVLNAILPFSILVNYFIFMTIGCVFIALFLKGVLDGISAVRQWARAK